MPEQNVFLYNSALAGRDGLFETSLWHRQQWTGIDGAPTSINFSASLPSYQLHGGVGARFYSDVLGPFRYNKLDISYAYHDTKHRVNWSLALSAGAREIRFDAERFRTSTGIYTGGLVQHNDPSLPDDRVTAVVPVVSAGTFFSSDDWDAGFSIQDVAIVEADFGNGLRWTPNHDLHLIIRYYYDLDQDWLIMPSVYIQSDLSHLQTMVKLNTVYKQNAYIGIGLRGYGHQSLESIHGSIGLVIDKHLTLVYGYDLGINGLSSNSHGSHEILVKYRVISRGGARVPRVIGNPRMLE